MDLFTAPAELRGWSDAHRRDGRRVGLVPTMGALHEGHFALVEHARRSCAAVALSIFVNPLQFERPDDLAAYPRPIDDDLDACRRHGVDAVYAPVATTMYPAGFDTHVVPGRLAELLEGEHRPGHFRGVATVVTKLFAAARPDVAVFGEKDFQQLAIVRRMAADLDLGVEVQGVPTVREPDGLARSSRNRRLSPAQREAARCVPLALEAMAEAHRSGVLDTAALAAVGRAVVDAEPSARFEHLDIVDDATLDAVDIAGPHTVALIAVWFDDIRLIDNRRLA